MQVLDDVVAPIKEIRLKTRTEPWMSTEILDNIRHRDQLLYKFNKDKTKTGLYKEYRQVRNKIQRDIRSAKSEYFSNQIEEHKNEPKKLWQQLKSLGYNNKSSKSETKVVLDINGETCFDCNKVANYFNEFTQLLHQH